jgi:hypothetical protein
MEEKSSGKGAMPICRCRRVTRAETFERARNGKQNPALSFSRPPCHFGRGISNLTIQEFNAKFAQPCFGMETKGKIAPA